MAAPFSHFHCSASLSSGLRSKISRLDFPDCVDVRHTAGAAEHGSGIGVGVAVSVGVGVAGGVKVGVGVGNIASVNTSRPGCSRRAKPGRPARLFRTELPVGDIHANDPSSIGSAMPLTGGVAAPSAVSDPPTTPWSG